MAYTQMWRGNTKFRRNPIEDFGFSKRITGNLKRGGIHTWGDLLKRSPRDLHKIQDIGAGSIEIIEAKLCRRGLHLSLHDPVPAGDAWIIYDHRSTLRNRVYALPVTELDRHWGHTSVISLLPRLGIRTLGDLCALTKTELIALDWESVMYDSLMTNDEGLPFVYPNIMGAQSVMIRMRELELMPEG